MIHKFVDCIPKQLEENTLYISMEYGTVVHSCACGCGEEVVTPLSPTDWKMTYNGESISIHPSIGNWSFKCRSHYWIRNNKVSWAKQWSDEEIQHSRFFDSLSKTAHFDGQHYESKNNLAINVQPESDSSFWNRIKKLWQP